VLVLTALEPHPDFPGVPAAVDLVSNPDDRQLLEVVIHPHRARRNADFTGVC